MTEVILRNLKLQNFKGIREKELEFSEGLSKVKGKNGVGKTTILTAWLWLICGKDANLMANPAVFPIGEGEYTPTVTAKIEINGSPVTIQKSQKRKVGKPDENGISKVSYTNNYEVNSVELTERDFFKTLNEKGIDTDNLCIFSHTDAFINMKTDEKRKILFRFTEKTDEKSVIAKAIKKGINLPTIKEKISAYNLNEIESMAKASIRKIKEVYGKDGEILNAKINGLDMGRTDTPESEADIKKKIDDVDKARDAIFSENKKAQEERAEQLRELKINADNASEELKKLMDKYEKSVASDNASHEHDRKFVADAIAELDRSIGDKTNALNQAKISKTTAQTSVADMTETVRQMNERADNAIICPTCGRPLDAEKAIKIREAHQRQIDELIAEVERAKKAVSDATEAEKKLTDEINVMSESKNGYYTQLEEIDSKPVKASKETKDLQKSLTKAKVDAEKALKEYSDLYTAPAPAIEVERLKELDAERGELNGKLAIFDANRAIDAKIADLRKQQMEYEQAKADAEKTLDEIDKLNRFINELVTESVNNHFSIVKWKFFDYRKNGEYTEVCDAYIDDKKLGESANTGREIIAKIDIAFGLQSLFEQSVPLFVDGLESLSSDSEKRIAMEMPFGKQLIGLVVSEDKELTQ